MLDERALPRGCDAMRLDVREQGSLSIVAASGELDATSGPDLERAVGQLLEQGRRSVLIDFADTTFIDSAGLATLVKVLKRVRTGGGKLCLGGLQPAVRRVFALTRLDKAFEIVADEAEAVRRLS